MAWIAVGMAAVNMVGANEKSKSIDKYNQGQAEVTRYSPWTGQTGQMQVNDTSMLGAAASGALAGQQMSNDGFFGKTKTEAPTGNMALNTSGPKVNSWDAMSAKPQNPFDSFDNQAMGKDPSKMWG